MSGIQTHTPITHPPLWSCMICSNAMEVISSMSCGGSQKTSQCKTIQTYVQYDRKRLIFLTVTSRPCNLWHQPGLPAGTIGTQLNGRKHRVWYSMEITLSDCCEDRGHISKLVQPFLVCFFNSWIYVEIMTQAAKFPIILVYCLPGNAMECTRSLFL